MPRGSFTIGRHSVRDDLGLISSMFLPPGRRDLEFFSAWLARDEGFLPIPYPRCVVILHPGTVETPAAEIPYGAPNANDDDLDDAQAVALHNTLLAHAGSDTSCTVAFYGGYMDASDSKLLVEAGLTKAERRLSYFLGATSLRHAGVSTLRDSITSFLLPSFIWPVSRDWFVASAPDLAFTVVGCDDRLATRLLDDPILDARLWAGSAPDGRSLPPSATARGENDA